MNIYNSVLCCSLRAVQACFVYTNLLSVCYLYQLMVLTRFFIFTALEEAQWTSDII